MSDAKKVVRDVLDRLPDGCTLGDVIEELRVLEAIDEGLLAEAAGHVVPHRQVVEEMTRRWKTDAP